MRAKPRSWWVIAALVAVVVNAGLLGTMALLTKERAVKKSIEEGGSISLVNFEPPEPPKEEELEEPEPPKPQQQEDFTPDLIQPDLSTPGAIDGGIAIDLDGLGGGKMDNEFVFESYELDQPPLPIVKSNPQYPFKAREQGVEGVVQVKILVRADGSVGEVQILASRPEGYFEESTMKTVPSWRFKAGTIEGKAVTAWVVTAVHYNLN